MKSSNDSWLSPVPKKNLSRMVTDKITEALANGQIKPGEYLPSETQLSESLNVGKSSVREATKMLEAVGVVEIVKLQSAHFNRFPCPQSSRLSAHTAK